MFYVGIDFGSTYTTVSVYRPETESLVAKALSEGGTPVYSVGARNIKKSDQHR